MIEYNLKRRLHYIPGGTIRAEMGMWPSAGIKANLISWWSLDETSGTRNDSHGTNHLTDNNTVTYATGKQSNAADFNRNNVEYLSIASNSTLQAGGTDFTVAMWALYHDTQSGNNALFCRNETGKLEFQITIRDSDKVARFVLWDAGTTVKALNSSSALSASTWYFLVFRWNNATKLQEVIVNAGTPATATQTGTSITSSTSPLAIGQTSVLHVEPVVRVTQNHDGLIDEVGFWKRVLTDDEVTWLYNSGNGRTYSEL